MFILKDILVQYYHNAMQISWSFVLGCVEQICDLGLHIMFCHEKILLVLLVQGQIIPCEVNGCQSRLFIFSPNTRHHGRGASHTVLIHRAAVMPLGGQQEAERIIITKQII